jgi:hypothetical protein
MKTYTDYDINIIIDEMRIPKNTSNPYYVQFLQELKNGQAELIPYTPPAPTWEQIRAQRDQLLRDTDWILSPDINLSNKIEWFNYRQQLRDLPETFATPEEVVWPEKPSVITPNAENENNLFKAELFINNFYSPTRLLQMKTWWDEIPHQMTPKLSATYVWIENVTKFAITSENLDQTNLQNFQPPFTFVDVSQEIRDVLYPVIVTPEPEVTEPENLVTPEPEVTEPEPEPEPSSTITEETSSTEVSELSS